MKYLYCSFDGGFYTDKHCLSVQHLCRNKNLDECDNCIGAFTSPKELWELLKPLSDIDGRGIYSLSYVYKFICFEFEIPIKLDFDEEDESILTCNLAQERLLEKIYELFD